MTIDVRKWYEKEWDTIIIRIVIFPVALMVAPFLWLRDAFQKRQKD